MRGLFIIVIVLIISVYDAYPQNKEYDKTVKFSIFHRRDASTVMDWEVQDGDTIYYQRYYPKGSDYFRYLVYNLPRAQANRIHWIEITSMIGEDTINHTNERVSGYSFVLQEKILGVEKQWISFYNQGNLLAKVLLYFRRKD